MTNNFTPFNRLSFFARLVASVVMQVMVAVLLLNCCGLTAWAQLPAGWSGIDIGGATAGSDSYASGVYSITGSGVGIGSSSDQMHFTYTTLSAGGNFRLTARVVGFSGVAGSEMGITVRQGTSSTGTMGAVAYEPQSGSGTNPNAFFMYARNSLSGALFPWKNSGNTSAMAAPCWLQFVRYGNNFSVYKSTDGIFWAQVQETSGGAFPVSGAIQVGFFVASGGSSSATATLDNVTLDTNPILAYESSWIGNNISADSTSYISSCATSMWVGSDGTCYVLGYWDEGGETAKIYKNGSVVSTFTLPGYGVEGAITSDGTHLYYQGRVGSTPQIYQTDMQGDYYTGSPQAMYLQTSMVNTGGWYALTGLACGNGELYISDSATGQVLVVNPSQTNYGVPAYSLDTSVAVAIDTSGVTNPAPQAVYQTAFQADLMPLVIPGLTVGSTYTVRLHFAELNSSDNAVGQRLMNLYAGSQSVLGYDIFATAGAINKATVVSFAGVPTDGSGNLSVIIQRGSGSQDGNAIINGVEIDDSTGAVVKLINCGGSVAGSWQTTIQEMPDRAFKFTRPGPIAVDKNGNLWIVQEGTNFPATGNFAYLPGGAAIVNCDSHGNPLGKQITDVVSPTAISYDSASDRLLVAENGPAQNIRIYNLYTGTTTAPACTSTLGVSGGVFAGSTPGVIHDAASGGDARFLSPTGVGMDGSGNIYVAGDFGNNTNQTDLRAFNSSGSLLWSAFALEMCNVGDFDPTVNASDVWTTTHHYSMNYSGSTAGGEWSLKSYITNPLAYAYPTNLGNGNAVYRKISGKPFLFTAGQGVLGPIYIYRFVGEQAVPCGSFTGANVGGNNGINIWTDTNGDGIQQPGEVTFLASAGAQGFDVDSTGSLYLANGSIYSPNVLKIAFQSLNSYGVPVYATSYTATAAPAPFNSSWVNARLRYVGGASDTMYLLGVTNPGASNEDYGGTLACYDHWGTSPVQRFVTVLPDPANNANFCHGAPPYTDGNGFFYMGFDVANGLAFCSELWGAIHVVDSSGNVVANINSGPEISGQNGWEDEAMGIRVHYNASLKEYDILEENSGWRGRQNFFRWHAPLALQLISDGFSAVNGTALASHTPGKDVPGTPWIYTGNTSYWGVPTIKSDAASLTADVGAAIYLNGPEGSYAKPSRFSISAALYPNTVGQGTASSPRGVGLGFYATPDSSHGDDSFVGVMLEADGTLRLVNSVTGALVATASQSYTLGTFNPALTHTVSYQVNMMTGAISNLSLTDANGTETYSFTTNLFTSINTSYAGFNISAPAAGQTSIVDNFSLIGNP